MSGARQEYTAPETGRFPPLEVTEFTSYNFTAEDYILAYTYTELQTKGLQTQLSKFAQQKLNLSASEFSSNRDYIRAQEYNRGLMDAVRFLLELHNSVKDEAVQLLKQQVEKQMDLDYPSNEPYRMEVGE